AAQDRALVMQCLKHDNAPWAKEILIQTGPPALDACLAQLYKDGQTDYSSYYSRYSGSKYSMLDERVMGILRKIPSATTGPALIQVLQNHPRAERDGEISLKREKGRVAA